MRYWLFLLGAVVMLTGAARSYGIPGELREAAPREVEEIMGETDAPGAAEFSEGLRGIVRGLDVGKALRGRVKSIVPILLAVVLSGAAKSVGESGPAISMAGVLAVTAHTAGSLERLIGLGWKTVRELEKFSRVLLPALAAATAASGAPSTAAFQEIASAFFTQTLIHLMDAALMPATYLYIGVLTASCALSDGALEALAKGIKKTVSGLLTVFLLGFTAYLSVFHLIHGTADSAAVKLTKTTLSNVVPVVGGILAEASEAMLAGAGVLKGSVGVFGLFTVLALCAYPFFHLAAEYLLYKAAALLASCVGVPELSRLLDGLGGAFALVLGMTGSCALLLFAAVLSFVSAVSV